MDLQDWINTNILELNELTGGISCTLFEDLAELILNAHRIFVFGVGRTGYVMQMFAMRLMHLGLKAFVIPSPTTPSIREDDLLIVGSGSGSTPSVIEVVHRANSIGTLTASITLTDDSNLCKSVKRNFPISCNKYEVASSLEESMMPLGTIFEQSLLVLLDSLCIYIGKRLGQTESKMQSRHSNLE